MILAHPYISRRRLVTGAAALTAFGALPRQARAAAHRYWRVSFPGGPAVASGPLSTDPRTGFAELEMRLTSGGADQLSGGTMTASSTVSGTAAGNLVDNDNSTIWYADTGVSFTQYITYDFGSGVTKDITEIQVTARPSFNGGEPGWLVISFSDDGTNFTPAWYGITTSVWSTPGETRTFAAQSDINMSGGHRYWRLYVDSNEINGPVTFSKIKLRTGSTTSDLGPLAEATASSEFSSDHTARNGLNIVAETAGGGDWGTASGTTPPQWFAVDFGYGNAPNIAHVTIKARTGSGGHTGAPKTGKWQYSDDGSTWVNAFTFSEANWSSGEERELTLAAAGGGARTRTMIIQ